MLKFLEMGGYAAYVWPSFGLTLLIALLNIVWARRSLLAAQTDSRRRLASVKVAS